MSKYRNTTTGRVVNVPDEAPTRKGRPKRDSQWAQNLARMNKSKRWERVADNVRVVMPRTRPKKRKKSRTNYDIPESTGNDGDQTPTGDGDQTPTGDGDQTPTGDGEKATAPKGKKES